MIRDDPDRAAIVDAIESRAGILVHILYSDHEGGQRTISRFHVTPRGEEDEVLGRVTRFGTGTSTVLTPAETDGSGLTVSAR